MNFFTEIVKNSKVSYWTDGSLWACWALFGALLPIWGTVGVLSFFDQDWNIQDLYREGQFALYTASFIASSLYIITRDAKHHRFPNHGSLILVLVVILVASVGVYCLAQVVSLIPGVHKAVSINDQLIGAFSWIFLPFVVVLSTLVVVVENIRLSTDIQKVRKDNLEDLNKEFEELLDNRD